MNLPNLVLETVGDGSTIKKRQAFTLIEMLVVLAIIVLLLAFLLPGVRGIGGSIAARRHQCFTNLKQIAQALLNYESTYHALPPAYTVDADGKPLHSWRTLILPFLEQESLYQKIDLSKAWDHPVNAEAYQAAISVYHCPAAKCQVNHTTYLAIVASNGCFRQHEPRPLSEITDKHGETLMLIEVASEHAVHWMAPIDADASLVLGFDSKSKLDHAAGTHAAFVDGSVRFLDASMSADERLAWISIAGNDK